IEKILNEYAQWLAEMPKIPKHQRVYTISDFDLADEFLKDVRSDLRLLREISRKVRQLDLVANDPKAKRLITEIKKILKVPVRRGEPKRKVIIFTEYIDTVKHLEPILDKA